jgi:hypothetical protein
MFFFLLSIYENDWGWKMRKGKRFSVSRHITHDTSFRVDYWQDTRRKSTWCSAKSKWQGVDGYARVWMWQDGRDLLKSKVSRKTWINRVIVLWSLQVDKKSLIKKQRMSKSSNELNFEQIKTYRIIWFRETSSSPLIAFFFYSFPLDNVAGGKSKTSLFTFKTISGFKFTYASVRDLAE